MNVLCINHTIEILHSLNLSLIGNIHRYGRVVVHLHSSSETTESVQHLAVHFGLLLVDLSQYSSVSLRGPQVGDTLFRSLHAAHFYKAFFDTE